MTLVLGAFFFLSPFFDSSPNSKKLGFPSFFSPCTGKMTPFPSRDHDDFRFFSSAISREQDVFRLPLFSFQFGALLQTHDPLSTLRAVEAFFFLWLLPSSFCFYRTLSPFFPVNPVVSLPFPLETRSPPPVFGGAGLGDALPLFFSSIAGQQNFFYRLLSFTAGGPSFFFSFHGETIDFPDLSDKTFFPFS